MSKSVSGDRLHAIDAARGVAVVLMILWHSADAWLRTDARTGGVFTVLRSLGGFAAPSFIFLAGVSLRIKSAIDAERGVPRRQILLSGIARGLEVLTFGYLLRVQMWAIDGGGLITSNGWRIWGALVPGWLAFLQASKHLTQDPRRALRWIAAGVAGVGIGAWQTSIVAPHKLVGIFREDVLQTIGLTLCLGALVIHIEPRAARGSEDRNPLTSSHRSRPWLVALSIALATPLVERVVPTALPDAIDAYLAKWPLPPGSRPLGLFPLFPWAFYLFAGLGFGAMWFGAARAGKLSRTMGWTLGVGAAMALVGNELLPAARFVVAHAPWLKALMATTYRLGIALFLVGGMHALARIAMVARAQTVLFTLGRHSLFVYWVHLELAYGIASRPWHSTMNFSAYLAGFAGLTALMWIAARALDAKDRRAARAA